MQALNDSGEQTLIIMIPYYGMEFVIKLYKQGVWRQWIIFKNNFYLLH